MHTMNEADVAAALQLLQHWNLSGNALTKQFVFNNFSEAFSFMVRVAMLAEAANHHPDWSNSYNKVTISWMTHDAKGITQKDVDLAKEIDRIV